MKKYKKRIIIAVSVVACIILLYIGFMYVIFIPKFPEALAKVEIEEKVIALTFDDGPSSPYTTEILDILDKHNVKATFFMVGVCVENNIDIAKDVYNRGHQIGNHTYNHPHMIFKSDEFVEYQILKTDSLLSSIGAPENTDFRPPYGEHMFAVHRFLKKTGRNNILFNVIVGDWKATDEIVLAENIMKKIEPGAIVLLHDGGGIRDATVKATDIFITRALEKGYTFVTVKELMEKNS